MKNLVAALTLRFMDRLSGPSRGAVRAVGMIERGQKMAAAASSQWSKGLDQLDSRLNRLASASLVTDGLGRAGEAMMRPLKAGVVASAEFNRGMTGIGITAQMTDAKLAPLRATIFSTANEIGALPSTVQATFGAVLAEGVYKTESELSRAGVAMAKFQRLQAVMGEPLSDAEAGSFSAAMGSSLKLRADQLDQANAMVNRSAQQGGVSGATLAKFLPSQTGALVGLNFANEKGLADLLTANQLAKRLAGSNDQAANNISNLMSKLASPEVLRNFSKIGIDMEKEIKAGVLRGVSPLQTVAEITGRQTKADQFRIGELFGDQQAKDGLMALVQNLDEFKAMSRELQSGDVLKGYFADLDRALQGPAASFDRYKSGIAIAGIATGTILAPAVGLAAGLLSKVANWMTEASESGSWLAKAAVWAFAGMAGLAVGAGMVGHAVVGILGPLFIMKTLLGPSGLGGAGFGMMAGKVVTWLGRMRLAAIGFNLSMLANPVVLGVMAAIAVIGLAAVLIRKYWQPIKAFFGGVGAALGEAFGPALSAIGGALRPLKPLWDAVAGAVGRFFGWIGRLMQPMQATKGQLDGASNAGRNFGRMLVLAFNLSPIGIFARGVMTAFRFIQGAMNWRPMETLRQAWSGVTGFFGGLITRFNGFGRAIMQGLIGGVRAMLGEVASAVVGVANGAVSRFKGVLGIKSPSRVFAALGGYTMEGLTMGLTRGGRSAIGQVAAVGGALVAAMPGATAGPAGSAMPAVLASLSAAPDAASAGTRGGASGGVHIEQVLIQVSIPAGADATRQGGMAGRAAADSFRARLYDGLS
ncbi:MAG: hypothetical protein P0Y50_09005 [Candidatus Brevundimonas colombiensis]|uniref:Phage tail tape measure protein n=1 Tax=Candidatus Brevundimonas colombiensis TaxID=3121376 RepID=A0AAJ6BKP2_9CAUL|nr:hypothetical protein [Brevundimonas sp.]WEK38691.1 MAG: hypothetical protein P0Y50_09005 [Brevundimonas sp.]